MASSVLVISNSAQSNSMKMFFDIETAPCPEAHLFMPSFEPAKNLRDPDKIMADIESKRDAWIEKLALSPLTGCIVAIGYSTGSNPVTILDFKSSNLKVDDLLKTEGVIIERFFDAIRWDNTRLVGFNSNHFDLPFLFRRAFKHGIKVPSTIWDRNYRLGTQHIDLMDLWSFSSQDRISLNNLAKFLGIQGKTGSGKHFYELMIADYQQAREYLQRDVEIVREIETRTKN